ncbi:MAG: hypothetical protein QXQ60_07040 [Thermofilum sp.]
MMIKIEKVIGGYRVSIGNDVVTCREVFIDDDEPTEIEEYANAELIYVEAAEVRKEGDVVRVYTLHWLLDITLDRHAKYLLGGIKITMGRW